MSVLYGYIIDRTFEMLLYNISWYRFKGDFSYKYQGSMLFLLRREKGCVFNITLVQI